jgi:hypothetical protein
VAQMSMGHGSFSTTMKYSSGVPATCKSRPQRPSETCSSESQTGRRWTLLPSNPERLAELKAELQEKLLQNVDLCGALGRTRTCGLLIRSWSGRTVVGRHDASCCGIHAGRRGVESSRTAAGGGLEVVRAVVQGRLRLVEASECPATARHPVTCGAQDPGPAREVP